MVTSELLYLGLQGEAIVDSSVTCSVAVAVIDSFVVALSAVTV